MFCYLCPAMQRQATYVPAKAMTHVELTSVKVLQNVRDYSYPVSGRAPEPQNTLHTRHLGREGKGAGREKKRAYKA